MADDFDKALEALAAEKGVALDPAKAAAIREAALAELKAKPKATPWWAEAAVLVLLNLLVASAGTLALSLHRVPASDWTASRRQAPRRSAG